MKFDLFCIFYQKLEWGNNNLTQKPQFGLRHTGFILEIEVRPVEKMCPKMCPKDALKT